MMNSNRFDASKVEDKAAEVVDWLKVIAHPERMMVLCHLIHGEQALKDLKSHSSLSQSALSQHLGILKEHKLVSFRKESQSVFYSLSDKKTAQLLTAIQHIYCHDDNHLE
ncbi:ArsR/SmtB family transcription factor [Aliivibrio kagoshimensis]|uniref:ArsR/SmtB family transcription factor n=1 Tax=Aliivibrio kagoshimensis TaxID=2910230 RepID=UPI003D0973B8